MSIDTSGNKTGFEVRKYDNTGKLLKAIDLFGDSKGDVTASAYWEYFGDCFISSATSEQALVTELVGKISSNSLSTSLTAMSEYVSTDDYNGTVVKQLVSSISTNTPAAYSNNLLAGYIVNPSQIIDNSPYDASHTLYDGPSGDVS